jgi:FMN phosphatase YigB (HAD superfamily)
MKTILVDAVGAFVIETKEGAFEIFEGMQQMLDEFSNKKIILTGANEEQFKKFGLDKMPYEVFTLKHDPEKTDPEYYKKMLEHFNLKVEDVVYFEHNREAVGIAQSVGINSYYYDEDTKDLESLKGFLDKNI